MTSYYFRCAVIVSTLLFCALADTANAQSGTIRQRRVAGSGAAPSPATNDAPPATPSPTATSTTATPTTAPPANSSGSATPADTARAYSLLQQKQYAAAAKEAKSITTRDPKNSEAWKIAGFAELNLKQYAEAAADLEQALNLQRTAKEEDPNTVDALAQAYVRTEKFDRALPLLVVATTRKNAGNSSAATGAAAAQPDPVMFYYRGLAEYRTGKVDDAERSLGVAVKADPKNAAALFYLGRIAFERNNNDAAIATLNRATQADARSAEAWTLLTYAYLRRAAAAAQAADSAKADQDYLNAARAGESLFRLKPDAAAATLYSQALIGGKQYARAATVLEQSTASAQKPDGSTLYLLGIAYSRTKNFPKAISALERAAAQTPADVNIYRELGYAYEITKQYAKALAAYQKGAQLAPADADFKASVERVQPAAK